MIPGTFIRFMYQILRSLIGRFVMVYFDDILIYSSSLKSHLEHLRAIFNTWWREQFYVNKKKCKFLTNIVAFVFGFIMSVYGVQADQSNIFTIMEWPTPRSIHDVRSFHDLAYFYRRFIKNFNSFIAHITKCVKGHIF
jgi:hypothetical protein